MKRAFLSLSFKNKDNFIQEKKTICDVLKKHNIDCLVFVDTYVFSSSQAKLMMKTMSEELDKCDILIAEVSDKAIGIGIEVGYAYAKGKVIIYLRKDHAEHSTTIEGLADKEIIYKSCKHLKEELEKIILRDFR